MTQLSELNVKINGDSRSLAQATRRASLELNKLDATRRKSVEAEKAAAAAYATSDKALSNLRRSINPLYAASKKYESQLKLLNAQLEAGKINQQQFDAINRQMSSGFIGAGKNIDGFNREVRAGRFATGNLAAQFNDIGVMLASGQSPFTLAIQQGTQVSQVLNMMGSRKEILGSLAQAMRSFISPISLVTVGLIAGGAALFQWGRNAFAARDNTSAFAEATKALTESTSDAADELERLNRGLSNQAQLLADRAIRAAKEELKELQAELDSYTSQLIDGEAEVGSVFYSQIVSLRERKTELEDIISSTEEDLALNRQTVAELEEAKNQASLLKQVLDKIDMDPLVRSANALKIQLGDAAAWGIAEAAYARILYENKVGGGRGLSPGPTPEEIQRNVPSVQLAYQEKFKPPKSGRGGGGGGKSEAEKLREETEKRVEALEERFSTETELQIQRYADDQELLKSALEQKLLTEKEYYDLMQQAKAKHEEKMAELEVYRHGSTLAKTETFLGDMASAFAKGNEKMLEIGKAFGAAEALVNAWRAYSQVMADPKASIYEKIPAAIAVFGAAMKAVTAIQGVGKGGSGNRSAGGGGGSTTGGSSASSQNRSTAVAINLQGEIFGRDQVISLINNINEAVEDGARIRLV